MKSPENHNKGGNSHACIAGFFPATAWWISAPGTGAAFSPQQDQVLYTMETSNVLIVTRLFGQFACCVRPDLAEPVRALENVDIGGELGFAWTPDAIDRYRADQN